MGFVEHIYIPTTYKQLSQNAFKLLKGTPESCCIREFHNKMAKNNKVRCLHCNNYLTLKTFRKHKDKFYDSRTRQWKRELPPSSESSDEVMTATTQVSKPL